MDQESEDLKALYAGRFGTEGESRSDLWEVLVSDFFQQWVTSAADDGSTVARKVVR